MADLDAYTFSPLIDSAPTDLDDLVIDRSVSGTAHGRAFYAARKRKFSMTHLLTFAQYASLLALYDANRLLRVTLTWNDGVAYVCFFNGPPGKPQYELASGQMRVRVPVELVQQ